MAGSTTAAHLAWTENFKRQLRAWMDATGLRYLDLADQLGYRSTSVIFYHLQRGAGLELVERLAERYPDQWTPALLELKGVLFGDSPTISPVAREAIHKLKEGMAGLAAGIEALESALGTTDESERHGSGRNRRRGGDDPPSQRGHRPGNRPAGKGAR
jgi:hypothetical protein